MLRITIELLPFGSEKHKRHMGTLEITNDATGTKDTGNYHFSLSKFGRPNQVWRRGEIKGFPRLKRGAFDLMYLVLQQAVGKRNRPNSGGVYLDEELPEEFVHLLDSPPDPAQAEGESK